MVTQPLRPAYLVVTAKVTDRPKLMAYNAAIAAAGLYATHGGRRLAMGPPALALEDWPDGEVVMIAEFPSRAAAEAFWFSDAYQQQCKPLRAGAGTFRVALFEAPMPPAEAPGA
jgi:uncharacterized protein (DUF1330 family)